MKPIGRVIEVEGLDSFTAVISSDVELRKFEFVKWDNGIGYVEWVKARPSVPTEMPWDVASKVPIDEQTSVVIAKVRSFEPSPPRVGQWVYLASDEEVEELYSVPPERSLHLGYLRNRPNVKINLDLNALVRHLAIIAATGSGKTWTSVVMIEELLKKGATVLILDPHGEYVPIKEKVEELGAEALVLKANAEQEGDVLYTIDLSTVNTDELAFVMGIPKNASKLRGTLEALRQIAEHEFSETQDPRAYSLERMEEVLLAIAEASEFARSQGQFSSLLKRKGVEVPERTLSVLWSIVRRGPDPAFDLLKYVEELKSLGVYGTKPTPITSFLRPATATIFNLSGIRKEVQVHLVYNVLKRVFEARVRYMRKVPGESYPYPVMVIVEEAHRFAPPPSEENLWTTGMLRKIASEGRKFGVFLTVITQRPSRVDQTVLSQCQSQIIMRLINPKDQEAVINSSEELGARLASDLPSLRPGEAIVLGPVVKKPAFVRIRDRVLDYGGGDIDLVSEWGKALLVTDKLKRLKLDPEKFSEYLGMPLTSDILERAKGILMVEKVYLAKDRGRIRAKVGPCSFVLGEENRCDPAYVVAALIEAYSRGMLQI